MAERKLSNNRILVIVLAVAAALAAVLIVVSLTRGGDTTSSSTSIQGGPATAAMLKGIAQDGNVLGKADAPVTLVEYADFECPYCGMWAREVLPTIVDEYVRPGKVRLVYNGLAFLSQDSVEALQAAESAGLQSKLWNVTDLIFRNQGQEGSGWVTDDFLRAVGDAVPGLDVNEMMDQRSSPEVATAMSKSQQEAGAAGINSTPTLEVGRTGGTLTVLKSSDVNVLDIDTLRGILDQQLAKQ